MLQKAPKRGSLHTCDLHVVVLTRRMLKLGIEHRLKWRVALWSIHRLPLDWSCRGGRRRRSTIGHSQSRSNRFGHDRVECLCRKRWCLLCSNNGRHSGSGTRTIIPWRRRHRHWGGIPSVACQIRAAKLAPKISTYFPFVHNSYAKDAATP